MANDFFIANGFDRTESEEVAVENNSGPQSPLKSRLSLFWMFTRVGAAA